MLSIAPADAYRMQVIKFAQLAPEFRVEQLRDLPREERKRVIMMLGLSPQQKASTKRASKVGQTKVLPIRPKVKVDFRKPRKIFQQFDKNKDDVLDREEVLDALQTIGCSMNKESFDAMFSDCDKNKDGGIDYKEFKKTM